MKTLGQILKEARQESGWTQEQAANLVGTSKSHICELEKDQYSPLLTTYLKLVKLYRLPICKLTQSLADQIGQDNDT